MRSLVLPAALAAMIVSAPFALAEQQTKGVVKEFDPTTKMLVLEDGMSYELSSEITDVDVQQGDEVTVTWDTKDGRNMATKVEQGN